jgi:hypothetical protein
MSDKTGHHCIEIGQKLIGQQLINGAAGCGVRRIGPPVPAARGFISS